MVESKAKWTLLFCSSALSFGWFAAGALAAAVTNSKPMTVQTSGPSFSVGERDRRLVETALTAGSQVLIRIFKKESELELWMQKDGRFELFRIYPICFWSGKLGPKMREGDKQAPEGFYRVDVHQLRRTGRNARSFYIDFPNALDQALGRTGSAIMVHGRCQSIGCFAMTDPAMEEIYTLVERALHDGQDHIEVHAFPFRMTESNLAAHGQSEWTGYWRKLQEGYDLFEQTRIPPKVSVCGKQYVLDAGDVPGQAMLPDSGAPPNFRACEPEEPGIASTPSAGSVNARVHLKSRTVGHRKNARFIAGRNARKAYAAARRARMGAYVKRMRTSEAQQTGLSR